MDITSTRLNALIGEALTPQPVPSPKAEPAVAALIKTLVQPQAPSTGQAAQIAAQSLQSAQSRPAARASQRLSSSEVEDAYRAVMEPDAVTDASPARPATGRAAMDADHAPRGFAPPQAAVADNVSRPAVAPALSTFSPAVASAAVLVAANANAPQPRGAAIRPAGHAPRSESAPISLWTISVVTAIVSAVTATIMVLLLR
ncbi:MAG: hypothetical protein EOS63_31845 [Mesorhizobium sp.]|uniref:hypothetical protein n=1 Tax=Mesorhizobium sp. TaxID=1871066 RepID=UPI000FE4FE1E|nr:hypothetical protein [Mesorhizobium sp.]RWE71739.1 MAG: hypothetical protein EOS63_31845 [Mesorhizobium sp.]TIT06238.1 MAG: hypothetical protein E5W74_30005 [Mesorhizobium sp.]TJW60193.1 MAG: hypothetical protein E5V97_25090 [Mesorhizobium sp.]